jgi:hypothetical protein
MRSNRLQLNSDKTEVLWCSTSRRLHQLPSSALSIDGILVAPVSSVRDLCMFIDSDLVMRTHGQRTVSRCSAALRQLRQIRRSLSAATFLSLVVALVYARLDYGNSLLVGIPAYLANRFQSVLNAAARLVYNLKRSDHITDALVCLHWLRASERIKCKVAVLTYKVIHGFAPRYLGTFDRIADLPGRRCLQSAETHCLQVPPYRLSTVGSRAFPVAGSRIWNDLPAEVTSAQSLPIFRERLNLSCFVRHTLTPSINSTLYSQAHPHSGP